MALVAWLIAIAFRRRSADELVEADESLAVVEDLDVVHSAAHGGLAEGCSVMPTGEDSTYGTMPRLNPMSITERP